MFYGIDLSKGSFKACIIGENREDSRVIKCDLHGEGFSNFLKQLTPEDYVAVEASTNTFWFVEQLQKRVKECFVIDPFKFSIIFKSKKKTDHIDAVKLAHKLKYHVLFDPSPDEFPTVHIPPKEVQQIRALFSSYNLLKREKNMTKNRIRSLLSQNGIFGYEGKNLSGPGVQEELLKISDESLKFQLKLWVDMLNTLEISQTELKAQILKQGRIFEKEMVLLTSIKGISPFIAIAMMSDIVDIKRFKNSKHFASYLRCAPTIDDSGDSRKIGKVNKHSRTLTMGLLVESMNHFRNGSAKMEAFYQKKRKGKALGKVRVAVVRKILSAAYFMLSRNEYYYYRDKKNHAAKIVQYERVLKMAS